MYTPVWDKRLVNTTDPALLTLSPPGTFIYRVVSAGFDGNSNFQACYTHVSADGRDYSQWAADNDQTILTEVTNATTADIMSNSITQVFTSYSQNSGQQIKITNHDGYFIFEATDGVPSDNSTNFVNTTASTLLLDPSRPQTATGTTLDNTNLPLPSPLTLSIEPLSDAYVPPTVVFGIILNGAGTGGSVGRPDDGMLYPRGFQTIGTGGLPAPSPDPDPDPTPDTLPAGPQFSFIASNSSADLGDGESQTFEISTTRYLNYSEVSANGDPVPSAPGGSGDWYLYYLDGNDALQTITLPVQDSLDSNGFRQIWWSTVGPDPETTVGLGVPFVLSNTNLYP